MNHTYAVRATVMGPDASSAPSRREITIAAGIGDTIAGKAAFQLSDAYQAYLPSPQGRQRVDHRAMKLSSCALAFALLFPVTGASALDCVLQGLCIKSNGDIRLSDYVRIGRFGGGKYTATLDALQIQGSGSTGDVSSTSTVVPGGVARIRAARAADRLNMADKTGSDPAGVIDSTAAFQAAINSVPTGSAVAIDVPPGVWRLASDVSPNGRSVSWNIAAGASFVGSGKLSDSFGFYYSANPDLRTTRQAIRRGTSAAPVADLAALDVGVKHTSGAGSGTDNAPASYRANYKWSKSANARVQGYFGEAIDMVGGASTFVEGGRLHGIVARGTRSSAYGAVGLAQSLPGTLPDFLISFEGEVVRQDGVDAPPPISFSPARYIASFVATARVGDRPDVGFVTNPYNAVPFRTGFMVAENSVDSAAYVNRAALLQSFANFGTVTTGLYTGTTTYAAIQMMNDAASIIRVKNGAGTSDDNVFIYSNDNRLVLGQDAAGVSFPKPVGFNGAAPVGKCSLTAALPIDGSASNAAIASAINGVRSCLLTNGLAQ
ncbi:hypothetical protein [Methylobacterium sp. WL8]|uniref:hypothetical protein n=1 Tax=Methylobacterium sp. WL8 TaxID=2603899 RepID=UPI0011C90AA3|nr:hypothetical protein [Methylobacterium sp. WL8]TXN78603.1 hypothetical protein FV234_22500 [Methylobacterium sp. WL8]